MSWPKNRNRVALSAAVLLVAMSATAAADIRVECTRLDGTVVAGAWSATRKPGTVAVRTPLRRLEFSTADLLAVRFLEPFSDSQRPDWQLTVWTADGSRFPADILDSDDGAVLLKTPFATQARVPLGSLAAVRWNRHPRIAADIEQRLHTTERTQDTLLGLREGTIRAIGGTLERLTPKGGSFTYRGRTLSFTPENAFGIMFAALQQTAAESATQCRISDGNRITGDLLSTTEDQITLRGVGNLEITLPVPTLELLTFRSDRLVFLSELEPATIRHHNALAAPWQMRRDRSVTNRPMSMDGQVYARGIGVHASTTLSYQLDSEFKSLAATLGIDDAARPGGSVVFRVLGDGNELFHSDVISGRDAPRHILVPLEGARTLTLVVEAANHLDLGDHANWANIRLIR